MKNKVANYLLHSYREKKFHKWSNQLANSNLKDIERHNGRLDPKFQKLAREYANDVLGGTKYAPWLEVYSAVAGSFKEGWIPNNYYAKIVVPSIKGAYGKIESLNSLSDKLFNNGLFPNIAYFVNGFFYSNEYDVLSEKELKSFCFRNSDILVFKIDNSLRGTGVYFFNKNNFDIQRIRILGNGVFQEYIHKHAYFNQIMPNSVATIRFTTVIENNGNCSLRACYLRVGRIIDTHVKSSSQISISVDLTSGELAKNGYTTNWDASIKHPDTGFLFMDKKIPEYAKCVSTVFELHKTFPFARCIGWDLVIDKNNKVKVMEWNGDHNGIIFSEATQGPCFADLGWEKLWKTT